MSSIQHRGWEASNSDTYNDDLQLVAALRAGDERAFEWLLNRYHTLMLRLAMSYVSNQAIAEEVVQETWLGVLQGLHRFEGRSSLKTWIYRILTNQAKTRSKREGRTVSFASLDNVNAELDEASVEIERFLPADHPRWPGHWRKFPGSWSDLPEERILSEETSAYIQAIIATLPPTQRAVITLRDIAGCRSDEVCNILGISETNQRVLLHRARSKVRRALEQHLEGE